MVAEVTSPKSPETVENDYGTPIDLPEPFAFSLPTDRWPKQGPQD